MDYYWITNAFSLQMLNLDEQNLISVTPVTLEEIKAKKDKLVSALGHADIAKVVSNMIGTDLPVNRVNRKLEDGKPIIVAQYTGGRLPEGATELPEGAQIKFVMVAKVNQRLL